MSDDVIARILARVELGPHGCLEWRGALNSAGRPVVKYERRTVLVARLVLRWKLGRPIAPRMLATHSCDNPLCVEPEHLQEGTFSDNLQAAWARRRRTRPSTFTRE